MILGSTGSIGTQTLDVVERHSDRFQVVGLSAGTNLDLLKEQVKRFRPLRVSVSKREDAERFRRSFEGAVEVLWGEEGHVAVARSSEADLVVSAIVGAAGLRPTLEALDAGHPVALANKESLVIAGELMTRKAKERGVSLLPIDSEHSAIFQALAGNRHRDVRRIVLTASGGPFFRKSQEELKRVTVDEALRHPNWKMGQKITIDSATLMNKGLEVIEASCLFHLPSEKIDVTIHPQSIVHSMVEYVDGSVIAQMGVPDMRCAISYALAYPERVESGVKSLDLTEVESLQFYRPDFQKFPCLELAYEAARVGRTMPAVLNAANEVAVARFLKREIGFTEIPRIISKVLERHDPRPLRDLKDLLEADRWARETAG